MTGRAWRNTAALVILLMAAGVGILHTFHAPVGLTAAVFLVGVATAYSAVVMMLRTRRLERTRNAKVLAAAEHDV